VEDNDDDAPDIDAAIVSKDNLTITIADSVVPHIMQQMKKVGGWFNPTAESYVDHAAQKIEEDIINDASNNANKSKNYESQAGGRDEEDDVMHDASSSCILSAMKAVEISP